MHAPYLFILFALFFSFSSSAMEKEKYTYQPEAFVNKTLNNMGYEFRPFEIVSKFSLEALERIAQDKRRPCRILEIGGAYGRFLRYVFDSVKEEVAANILYDFCELDPGHVELAQKLFHQSHPKHIKSVQFITADAQKFLEQSQDEYHIIIINNVLHFFSPTKFLDTLKLMKKRLSPRGEIQGLCMTHLYNPEKKVTEGLKPGPYKNIPMEELERQIFEYLRTIGCHFPGFPGLINPFKKQSTNKVDLIALKQIFQVFAFVPQQLFEFSIDDNNCYSSKRRWVAFVLLHGEDVDDSLLNNLYARAKIEESLNAQQYQNFLNNPDSAKLYQQWFKYLDSLGVPNVSRLTFNNDKFIYINNNNKK